MTGRHWVVTVSTSCRYDSPIRTDRIRGGQVSTGDEQVKRMRENFGEEWGRFAAQWVAYPLRTAPIEPDATIPAIESLYALAGLGKPRVVIVPSPGVMAFAGTFAAEIWARRSADSGFGPAPSKSGTPAATERYGALVRETLRAVEAATVPAPFGARNPDRNVGYAVLAAAYNPADLATVENLDNDVWLQTRDTVSEMEALSYWQECIREAMRDMFGNPKPTEMMAAAIQHWAQPLARKLFSDADAQAVAAGAANWWQHAQGGNQSLYDTACIAAARDLCKLSVPQYQSFAVWERSLLNGGYRYLHPEFCLVCDFPEIVDEDSMVPSSQVRRKLLQQRQAEPVLSWRDGWVV